MIRRVAVNFVPVAVNLYKVRAARDAAGDLFRSVQKQKDQYQGLWVVAPDGKVLAGHHQFASEQTWTAEVLATLDDSLRAFGPVTPRQAPRENPLPFRGLGVRPDGTIALAIEVRSVYNGRPEGDGVIDTLPLLRADWAALEPPKPEKGTAWTVPERVARQFSRLLSPSSDQSTMPRPEEVTSVKLRGAVRAVSGDIAQIDYDGTIAATRTYLGKTAPSSARLQGVGTFDLKAGRLTSFLLVSDGKYRMAPPYDKELRSTAAAVEWRAERPRERVAVPARRGPK